MMPAPRFWTGTRKAGQTVYVEEVRSQRVRDFWGCTTTWSERYDQFGATGYMLIHAKCKEWITVVDVGCSTGDAINESKKCLARHNIALTTIGIDMSKDVEAKAKANLDRFIPKNVLDVNEHAGEADVVLCMNATRYVTDDVSGSIIRKCTSFLKPNGVLITGVQDRYRKKLDLLWPKTKPPETVCFKQRSRVRRWVDNQPIDTRMMARDEACRYADMLVSDWRDKAKICRLLTRLECRLREKCAILVHDL